MPAAGPLVVATVVTEVEIEAEAVAVERHGPIEVGRREHHGDEATGHARAVEHLAGGGGALADAGGDAEAAEGGAGDGEAGRGGGQVGVDGVDAVEVAGAVLGERAHPAAHPHLGRLAAQRHRVAQVGEHRGDERVVVEGQRGVVAVAADRRAQPHRAVAARGAATSTTSTSRR